MDARGAPERVLLGHPMNQPDELGTDARPTPGLPSPEVPESPAVPSEDGLRPDQDNGRAPLLPDLRQAHPEGPVGPAKPGPRRLVAENGELLPEGEIFQSQLGTVPEEGTDEQEDDSEVGHRCLPLGKLADRSGWCGEYAAEGTQSQDCKGGTEFSVGTSLTWARSAPP